MKTASPALIAHLNTARQLLMADLYTFTLANGTVYRFTGADVAITSGGNVFSPTALLKRNGTHCRVGISVDNLDITATGAASFMLGGYSFAAAAVRGDFDRATVLLERAWFTDWTLPPVGTINQFQGNVSDVECDRMEVRITVKSSLERFNILMPRRVYQVGCPNALYDHSCGLVKSAFGATGTILAGSTNLRPVTTLTGTPPAWATLGTIEFTSGQNTGQKRTVKANEGGVFELVSKLPFTPAIGDSFTAFPGCDKTMGTCTVKFANVARYRGQPYIPRPDTVL